MKLYLAVAVHPDILGDKGTELQDAAARRPSEKSRILKPFREGRSIVSSMERCLEFLGECEADGLVSRGTKRYREHKH